MSYPPSLANDWLAASGINDGGRPSLNGRRAVSRESRIQEPCTQFRSARPRSPSRSVSPRRPPGNFGRQGAELPADVQTDMLRRIEFLQERNQSIMRQQDSILQNVAPFRRPLQMRRAAAHGCDGGMLRDGLGNEASGWGSGGSSSARPNPQSLFSTSEDPNLSEMPLSEQLRGLLRDSLGVEASGRCRGSSSARLTPQSIFSTSGDPNLVEMPLSEQLRGLLRDSLGVEASGRCRGSSSAMPTPRSNFSTSGNFNLAEMPLSEQLRCFHQVLQRHEHQTAEEILEETLKSHVLQPLGRFQSCVNELAAEQRRMQRRERKKMRELEAEGARQQEYYKEQVLRLQEAMLEQSVQREQALATQLQELDRAREDSEKVKPNARIQELETAMKELRKQAMPATVTRGSETAPVWDASPKTVVEPCAAALSRQPPLMPPSVAVLPAPKPLEQRHSPAQWQQPQFGAALDDFSFSDTSAAMTPISPGFSQAARTLPPPEPTSILPQGLPRVYEAALMLILEHGWNALHGGEYSGPAWTALHWAALHGRSDVCNLLLQSVADPCHLDDMGKTALDYAIESGMHSTAALLRGATLLQGARHQQPTSMRYQTSTAGKISPIRNELSLVWDGIEQRV